MLENLTPDQIDNLIFAGAGLVGAVIGAGATLLSTWLTKKLQTSGKVTLHIALVGSEARNGLTFGFYEEEFAEGLVMRVPIWLDVCNTSGISRIVRNASLFAYCNKELVAEFAQIQAVDMGEKRKALGDQESYTVVVPENSARRFNMEFILRKQDIPKENKQFDELIFTCFDEKNRINAFHFMNVQNCWIEGPIHTEDEWSTKWITLKRRCRYAR